MHSTSDLVIILVYLLYGIYCMVHCSPCLMVCMDILIMGTCSAFVHRFKPAGMMCSLKSFMLNLFSPLYTNVLKPLSFYMLVTVWSSLVILSGISEIKFSTVSQMI